METTYLRAINLGLQEEMARDPAVYVLGEDVTFGGPFGVTKGLVDAFGDRRVLNTPISEDTVTGLAIGAAILGLRPVLELMFIDFIPLAMNQLVNHGAKLHYMSGGQVTVPLTVRTVCGAGGGWGAHHSQSLEAWFLHVPGLKVVMPATPEDARGLLKAGIRDSNPVLFIEHRGLYFTTGEITDGDAVVPLGVARVARQGQDCTVVSASRAVLTALEAADHLEAHGLSVEVIDLRSLAPLDLDTILASVRKTHRLVIVHEAVLSGGFGAELVARVQEAALDELDAPILRVAAPHAPVPGSPVLERSHVPDKARVVEAVLAVAGSPGRQSR